MPVCGFCGHDSHEGARTCVACGNVLAPRAAGDPEPTAPSPETEGALRDELAALGSTGTATAPAAPPEESERPAGLSGLFDPEPVTKAARQAWILFALAAALTVASAVTVIGDVADARDALGGVQLFRSQAVELTGRVDRLTLAELSLAAGALVMLGGWAQQVAANRALLGGTGDRSARRVLLDLAVPGLSLVRAGGSVTELWHDATPAGAEPAPPRWVRAFGPAFGLAVAVRVGVGVWAMVAFPDVSTSAEATRAGVVLVGARVTWLAGLAAASMFVRALTRRQVLRAGAPASG